MRVSVLCCSIALAISWTGVATPAEASPARRTPGSPGQDSGSTAGGRVSQRATGGPDGYGFSFADQASGCTFQFVDISGTGSNVLSGNAASVAVPLSQPFNLYGRDFTTLIMAVDGYITTDPNDDGSDASNDCPVPAVPSFPTGTEGRRIYVDHDNLILGGGSSSGFTQFFPVCPRPLGAAQPCTVMQWNDIDHFPTATGAWDMQALLYHDSSEIVVQVGPGDTQQGLLSTIGLQSDPTSSGFTGLTYSCNTAGGIVDNTAVCYTLPSGPNLSLTQTVSDDPVQVNQTYSYLLMALNAGPGGQTGVVVTDELPAEVTYLGNDCGATESAGVVTWTIGSLAAGASASCSIEVRLDSCGAAINEASVTGDVPENPSNNFTTTTVNSSSDAVTDGNFESTLPPADNPNWDEASTNFGSPLCAFALCGDGGGLAGPRSGSIWAWLGGATAPETGSVSQSITIPTGDTALLTLHLWNGESGGTGNDFVEVTIDGDVLFTSFEGNPIFTADYAPVTLDVTNYADGGAHVLEIRGVQTTAATTNFSVDDISLFVCGETALQFVPGIPAVSGIGFVLLVAGLLAATFFLLRRRRLG